MNCKTPVALFSLVLGSLSSGSVDAAMIGTQTFDSDAGGFESNTTSSVVTWQPSDGNPDGNILTRKDLEAPQLDIGARTSAAEFTGDYAADGIDGTSVDLNFLTDNVSGAWLRFRKDVFTNGWRYPLTDVFLPTDTWNTYAVTFDPSWSDAEAQAAGWVTDLDIDPAANPSPPFANVMSAVGLAEVRIASEGSTLVAIDNFRLVPEPGGLTLALLGTCLLWRRRRSQ